MQLPSLRRLFRTKSIYRLRETAKKRSLRKSLGTLDILLMGIGAIIGTASSS